MLFLDPISKAPAIQELAFNSRPSQRQHKGGAHFSRPWRLVASLPMDRLASIGLCLWHLKCKA